MDALAKELVSELAETESERSDENDFLDEENPG